MVQTLLRGSGFQNGKERIYGFYQNITDKKERVSAIRKEYGQGGAGWPLEGYGLHGYDTFHGKGLRLQWRDEEGEKEGYVSWTTIEAEIGALILTGDYYQPVIKEDIEPDYEEEDEVIDDIKLLAEGMKMLEYDYLGGSGSRGYGKVQFFDMTAKVVIGALDDSVVAEVNEVLAQI